MTTSRAVPMGTSAVNRRVSPIKIRPSAKRLIFAVGTEKRTRLIGRRGPTIMGRPGSLGWLSGTARLAHDKIAVEEDLTSRQVGPDIPANALSFSLDAGAPVGASINPTTGQFSWLPTVAQTGMHSITIRVTDNGSPAMSDSETITVTVRFGICVLFDQTMSHKKGSTIPIKLNLCDSAGNNVSASTIPVQAVQLVKLSASASPFVADDSGNANPDSNFRFAGDSYIFNLSTKRAGFSMGEWGLTFGVGTPSVTDATYIVKFFIK